MIPRKLFVNLNGTSTTGLGTLNIPERDAGGLEDGGGLGSPDPAGAEGLGLGCGVLNLKIDYCCR